MFPCDTRGRSVDGGEEEEDKCPALEEKGDGEEEEKEEECLVYAVEEEETEWIKVRFVDQIQIKPNAALTFLVLVVPFLIAPVPVV